MWQIIKENIRIAYDSIKGQMLRAFLTILIIAIGITALVGILSAVNALEATISNNFSSLGSNTFYIEQYQNETQGNRRGERKKINPKISYADAISFKRKFKNEFSQPSIYFWATSTAEVKYFNKKTDPEITVYGADENYLDNAGLQIDAGRGFNFIDVQENIPVCVIGSDFKKGIFEGEDLLNKEISVKGVKLKVIGILKEKGATFGNNQDLRVFIPFQLARNLYSQNVNNYGLSVKVTNNDLIDLSVAEATMLMRNIRKLTPLEENNFGVVKSDEIFATLNSMISGLTMASWIISIITIVGSSIALLNIMFVSVTERTREIGVRKSLGATRFLIGLQFFVETLLISVFGSLFGIIFGVIIGYIFAHFAEMEFVIPWSAMFWALVISGIVALFSGLFPSLKAAKLDPVESLRYE